MAAKERISVMAGPRVLIRRDREAETTEAGITLTEASRQFLNTGTVVYAGLPTFEIPEAPETGDDPYAGFRIQLACHGSKYCGSIYTVGSRVLFHPLEGLEVQMPDKEMLTLVNDEAIVALLEPVPVETQPVNLTDEPIKKE